MRGRDAEGRRARWASATTGSAALEKVKTLHVEPGKQPDLIRDLAREAESTSSRKHDLVTVPPLADGRPGAWR